MSLMFGDVFDPLLKILAHAATHVPYYRGLFRDCDLDPAKVKTYTDFTRIPLLEKGTVQEQDMALVDERLRPEDLIVSYTSGSTGSPLKIYRTRKDRMLNAFTLWECRRQWDPQVLREKQITFHGRAARGRISYDAEGIKLSMLELSDSIGEEYYEVLARRNYYWLFGPPSVVSWFADFLRRTGRDPSRLGIHYIELSGELLLDSERTSIWEVFRCPVVNHYGAREVRAIAFECPERHLHILSKNVFVETLETGLGDPEIVITSLLNAAQPFLRYRLNDFGRINHVDCACGKSGPVLRLSGGRTTEYAVLEDGRRINSYLFYRIILDLNEEGYGIERYQVVQETPRRFRVFLDESGGRPEAAAALRAKIQSSLGPVELDIGGPDFVAADRLSGKFKPFLSRVAREEEAS